jgi:two-component system, sensor histidine kinase RegB
MGLGVFIALSLLDRGGAAVAFDNRPEGGARVVVRWDRAILEGGRIP